MLGYDNVPNVMEWHKERVSHEVIEALTKRNFQAHYFETKEECNTYLQEEIKLDEKVSCGGSVTLEQLGIIDKLEERGNTVIHSFRRSLSKEEQFDMMRQGMLSDVFLSSANAITKDGRLYFVDGVGNRISSVIFGPKKTIIIAGWNKIVDVLEDAVNRVRQVAAPMNLRRYYKEGRVLPPCATVGRCCDCKAPLKVCNIKMVLDAKPSAIDFEVLIVGEELGF